MMILMTLKMMIPPVVMDSCCTQNSGFGFLDVLLRRNRVKSIRTKLFDKFYDFNGAIEVFFP